LKKEKKATEFSIEREIEVTILIMIMVMKRGIAIPPLKFQPSHFSGQKTYHIWQFQNLSDPSFQCDLEIEDFGWNFEKLFLFKKLTQSVFV
jgi:hypothetical protein